MSKRHTANESGSSRSVRRHSHMHAVADPDALNDNVVRRLTELFQESFDLEIIQSVAQTCQWDLGKATEALIVLGGSIQPKSRRGRRVNSLVDSALATSSRYKTKSLPSTLKAQKSSSSGRLSDSSTHSMPNALRSHPAYFSNDSLSSGQVWQRHYKSKPQSPGLLTMIPPSPKDKVSKPGSSRSSSRASSIKELPEVRETSQVILRIEKLVQSNVKVMILMRGVPGAGKSHLAQVVVQMVAANDRGQHVFSTDDYFVMLGRGVYAYDADKLAQAHCWNQKRVSEALRRAVNPVVVDNTHTQAWEMKPYVAMGVQHGYHIEVLEPVTPWRMREAELARRNVHNVPREKIRQMLERYEPGWTGEKLLKLFQLKYQHCGAAHVSPEITNISNSPLAQHRQHNTLEQPEKPKRKRSSPGKKDRRQVPGVEINTNQEQQLEELNKIFAEYGKTIDPESRQKVLDAGVPIFEVVSRIRRMQGTVLPLPGVPSITEEETPVDSPPAPASVQDTPTTTTDPDYFGLSRQSPTDSVEPDTMSSSNSSQTSECESDSEPEPLRRYLDDCGGHFVEGEDQWEDEEEVKSEGAVSGRSNRVSNKSSAFVTSSQEELSIIDYQLSTPAGSSQDELSFLEFQRGCTPNGSSSSSEEPKTELSTLQDSLRDVLLRSAAAAHVEPDGQLMRDIASQTGSSANLADLAKPVDMPSLQQIENNLLELALNNTRDKIRPKISEKPKFNTLPNGRIENISKTTKSKKKPLVIKDTVDNIDVAIEDDVEPKVNGELSPPPQLNSIDLCDSLMEILTRRFQSDAAEPVVDKENNVVEVETGQTAKSPDLEEIPLPRLPEDEKSAKMKPKLETILESVNSPPDTDIVTEPIKKGGLLQHVFDAISWSSLGLETVVENPTPEAPKRPGFQNLKEISTQIEAGDFQLWSNSRTSDPYSMLPTSSRLINAPDTPLPVRNKAFVAAFDKGTMTADNDSVFMEQEGLQVLAAMFPDVPTLDLADLLEKCQYDIQWVAELITDPSYTNIAVSTQPESVKQESDSKLDSILADGKKTIKRRKDRRGHSSELTQLLKKEIESGFQISNDHYSDHVLFIKKLREGQISFDTAVEQVEAPEECIEPVYDTEWNEAVATGPVIPASLDGSVAEPVIPMTLDSEFLRQLVNRFGNSAMPIKGSKAVVKIPESLAQMLYWLWVESLSEDVAHAQEADEDDMMAADALLAAALQEEELSNRQATMQELLDMDLAEKLMLNDHERARGEMTNTVAAVLSKKLLLDKYPHLDRGALLQVFKNEDCSLQRTCDTLQALYGPPRPASSTANVPSHPTSSFEANSSEKSAEGPQTLPLIVVKEPTARTHRSEDGDVLVVDPSALRLQIQLLQQKRVGYQRLGKEEISKKNFAVASHFFQQARALKEEIQEVQASPISQQSFPPGESLPTTLDLHYLFKGEAVQFVDVFLDLHIARLPSGRQELRLITGRGKNSQAGMSRIKPVVQKRLQERQLSFIEDNPGMLRVTVHPNDLLSTAL